MTENEIIKALECCSKDDFGNCYAEDGKKLTISFTLENTLGYRFSATTTKEVFNDLGEKDIDFIGNKLNIFLKQCGYFRKNDHIFMEDVTEEELEALADYLAEIRRSEEIE